MTVFGVARLLGAGLLYAHTARHVCAEEVPLPWCVDLSLPGVDLIAPSYKKATNTTTWSLSGDVTLDCTDAVDANSQTLLVKSRETLIIDVAGRNMELKNIRIAIERDGHIVVRSVESGYAGAPRGGLTISGSSDPSEASAVYNAGSFDVRVAAVFANNEGAAGGALMTDRAGVTTFSSDATFVGNDGTYGGAIFSGGVTSFAPAYEDQLVVFLDNRASMFGGAIHVAETGIVSFGGATIFEDNAVILGGSVSKPEAMFVSVGGIARFVTGSCVLNNNATAAPGSIFTGVTSAFTVCEFPSVAPATLPPTIAPTTAAPSNSTILSTIAPTTIVPTNTTSNATAAPIVAPAGAPNDTKNDTNSNATTTSTLAPSTISSTGAPSTIAPSEGGSNNGTQAPSTDEATEAPSTTSPTAEPTEEATHGPTEGPTDEPTEKPTEEPTERPTEPHITEPSWQDDSCCETADDCYYHPDMTLDKLDTLSKLGMEFSCDPYCSNSDLPRSFAQCNALDVCQNCRGCFIDDDAVDAMLAQNPTTKRTDFPICKTSNPPPHRTPSPTTAPQATPPPPKVGTPWTPKEVPVVQLPTPPPIAYNSTVVGDAGSSAGGVVRNEGVPAAEQQQQVIDTTGNNDNTSPAEAIIALAAIGGIMIVLYVGCRLRKQKNKKAARVRGVAGGMADEEDDDDDDEN